MLSSRNSIPGRVRTVPSTSGGDVIWGWLGRERRPAMAALPAPGSQARGHGQGGGALANTSQLPLGQAFPLSISLYLRHGSPRFNPACLHSANTLPFSPVRDLVPGCLHQGSPRTLPPHRRDLYGQLKFQGPYGQASLHNLCFTPLVVGGDETTLSETSSALPWMDRSLRPLHQ